MPGSFAASARQRADALAATYLGRNAAKSLFAAGEEPAAFLAITLHTLELAAPCRRDLDLPLTLFSVLPQKADERPSTKRLNLRTEEAAAALHRQSRPGRARPW